jgi:hypothetical protein
MQTTAASVQSYIGLPTGPASGCHPRDLDTDVWRKLIGCVSEKAAVVVAVVLFFDVHIQHVSLSSHFLTSSSKLRKSALEANL